jgi:aspartyl-tRNA(Asn)/glutamyl-tRNA(Gln) amidotransferase subunit B
VKIDCVKFAKLIELVDSKTINRNTGKKLLVKVFEDGIDPVAYVEENKLGMVSDTGAIDSAVEAVLLENEGSVREYKAGSQKVLGFLVGQVMRKMGGKADPKIVNECLMRKL